MYKKYAWVFWVYGAWLIGYFILAGRLDRDAFRLYSSLPLTGPLALLVIVQLLAWIVGRVEKILARHRAP
ncbi:MAG: hypothetical protein M0Z94_19715 [Dehalococcoidales bacterium]|nr:hypothetical protein [Dehalococcoidales bacterium]